MTKWYVNGPKGWNWPGRCCVEDSAPNFYTYFPDWPASLPAETGMFHSPLTQLIDERKWMSLVDPDLEMDIGL